MLPSDSDNPARGSDDVPDDDLEEFIRLLNKLKSTGCNILVCGDVPRRLLTLASGKMLGADDELRYRVLAITDASADSVAGRLPDPDESPRPITETTHVINHAGALRSVTAATGTSTPPKLAGVTETRIADPGLDGLQSALVDAISEFAAQGADGPADVRVGIDSLAPLLDFYGRDVVADCLQAVGGRARHHDAMAHYVLPEPYDSDAVRALADRADAVVEVRLAKSPEGAPGQQRWHVPDRDIETGWIPL